MRSEAIVQEIKRAYGENAEYLLGFYDIKNEIEWIDRYEAKGDVKMADFSARMALEKAEKFNGGMLTPATVKVGDGVTLHLWSDSHAGTIIKTTKYSFVWKRDKAIRVDKNGMSDCQTYEYERDPEGEETTFRWSKKYNCYCAGCDQSIKAGKGRHEYYDYSF